MIRFLKIATTWSIPGWAVISLVRWAVAWSSHDLRKYPDCLRSTLGGYGTYWDETCIAKLETIYQAEVSAIWNHWWILTIVLCLLWFMVRYANPKTQKEEPDVSQRPTED